MAVTIRGKCLPLPILQGGMGVGISLERLAGAVTAQGGMGTLSTAMCGFSQPDFAADPRGANLRALDQQVRRAKELSHGAGLVAVNAMVATTQYADSVRTALRAGADAIVCGAGLPRDLPAIAAEVPESDAALAPIVSGARSASVICRLWDRHYGRVPDFVVLEGPLAGGHLGFSKEDALAAQAGHPVSLSQLLREVLAVLAPFRDKYQRDIPVFVAGGGFSKEDALAAQAGHPVSLSQLLREVLAVLAPFRDKYQRDIPVFVAGGVRTGGEMARYMKEGAAGAQFATRFIATRECDASDAYKQVLLNAGPEDIAIVQEMARYMKEGAAGAQFATRFIATRECDASDAYKQVLLNAGPEDIAIVQSPVGMPGRALRTPLIRRVEAGTQPPVERCVKCLSACDCKTAPYCISRALIAARNGDLENGLFFCGAGAGEITSLSTVPAQMDQIMNEWRAAQ